MEVRCAPFLIVLCVWSTHTIEITGAYLPKNVMKSLIWWVVISAWRIVPRPVLTSCGVQTMLRHCTILTRNTSTQSDDEAVSALLLWSWRSTWAEPTMLSEGDYTRSLAVANLRIFPPPFLEPRSHPTVIKRKPVTTATPSRRRCENMPTPCS